MKTQALIYKLRQTHKTIHKKRDRLTISFFMKKITNCVATTSTTPYK